MLPTGVRRCDSGFESRKRLRFYDSKFRELKPYSSMIGHARTSRPYNVKEIHQGSEAQQRTDGPDERSLAARVPAAAQQLQSRLAGSGSEPGREAAVNYRSGLAASLCGRGGQLTTRDQKVDTVGTVRRSQSV